MSFFRQPTPAPEPRTKDAKRIAIFYAIILVIFAVTQLFTFDSFLELMVGNNFPVSQQLSYLLTALLVACEVFALPFLLRMPLSRAFRWVSMVAGWIVALLWLKLSFWIVLNDAPVDNVGYFGTVVTLMPGWWAVFVALSLVILAAWASWGLWPNRKTKKRTK